MKSSSGIHSGSLCFLVIYCLAQLPVASSQTAIQSAAPAASSQPAASQDVTPYEKAVPDPTDHVRLKRSGRYNSEPGTEPLNEDSYSVLEIAPVDPSELPDLPVNHSDAIIVGTIAEQHTYLSADHTALYTEFKIQIEQPLKAPANPALKSGELIDAERQGGSIRFPSGAIIDRAAANKTLPWTGKRYLLFLAYLPEGRDFSLVTGFRLERNQAIPLDKSYAGSGGTETAQDANALPPLPPPLPDPRLEFTPGMTEAQLLDKVKLAIASRY